VDHGGRFLREALVSTNQIDFPADCFEVLVVGADDDDEARHIVEAESRSAKFDLRYVGCSASSRSARLNAACAVAQGTVLVFADDDCRFLPDWIQKLRKVLQQEPNVGIVGGVDELDHEGSAFDLALDWVLNSFLGTGGLRRGEGFSLDRYYPKLWNMAVPREVAFNVASQKEEGRPQIFNESLVVHEDVDLAKRIEYMDKRIVYAPEVRIKHRRDTTFASFIRRNFSMARTCRTLGVHRLPQVLLTIFALCVVTLAISSLVFQPSRVVFLASMGVYLVPLLATAVAGYRHTKRVPVLVLIPLLLTALHIARGLGYLFPWRTGYRGRGAP
jgi:cellulose synthase/poly-beta-1,6-N-acetylglucosamine synthase-like glycosyltransferase